MIVPASTHSCSSSEPRQKQGRPVIGISRGNLCVTGYALHPTTLDLSQGMYMLEDIIVLTRSSATPSSEGAGDG